MLLVFQLYFGCAEGRFQLILLVEIMVLSSVFVPGKKINKCSKEEVQSSLLSSYTLIRIFFQINSVL